MVRVNDDMKNGVYAADEDPAIVALAKELNILEEDTQEPHAGRLSIAWEFADCALATD